MKEYGVIMSGGSISAILSGVKTMTRRMPNRVWERVAPGDRLWVRETWQAWACVSQESDEWDPITREVRMGEPWNAWIELRGKPDAIEYRADGKSSGPWTPALHMPRWASRITLEVTAVRKELLQDITEEDAVAEGAAVWPGLSGHLEDVVAGRARARFVELWDKLHGDGQWATNPVVRVISFRRIP